MSTRTQLLREALVFQGKLLIDGFRDLLLLPVSMVAVSLDLLARNGPAGRHFRELLLFGQRTERWIGLFNAADRLAPESDASARESAPALNMDDLVDEIERVVMREYERSGSAGSAREILDRVWTRIDRRRRARKRLRERQ